ncbi:MAG TPA: 5-formyltetrahydrofolate cyclo-ligase [Spirochaetota bacterium]|nr:5-formyltetrahydrofolate cyclo-ligase [Spirochaetota bacterium]HPP04475.1 5-formyltetrahydrofolate cyclo-ligase [Spirochaetota bacterium]
MLSGRVKFEKLKEIIPDFNKINFDSLNEKEIITLDNIYKFYFEENKNFLNKKDLRKIFKAKRDNLPKDLIKKKSKFFTDKFLDSVYYKKADTIFCYVSFNNEIITDEILKQVLEDKKNLCIPLMIGKDMYPCKVEDLNNLKKNKFGILEPTEYTILDKNQIDVTIVPAILFNPLGFRLGYGGGYYDRFLEDYKNLSIGFAFSDFCIDYFIPDRFDKRVDILFIQ